MCIRDRVKAVLSMVKLSVIVFGVYWVAGITECVLTVVSGSEIAFFTVLISKILGTIIIARVIRDISKLHMGIEQMSTGGVDGKINTKGMMLPIKMEADSLNNICLLYTSFGIFYMDVASDNTV